MKYRGSYLKNWLLAAGLLLVAGYAGAQQQPPPPGMPQKDTSKTNNPDWEDEQALIDYRQLHSEKLYTPDTSLHIFHRRPFTQPWYRNLGNHGGPVRNLLFTPEYRVGPTLGYHVFDVYRFDADSVGYYNSSKPYSEFVFQLASKQEQMAYLMHSQNIRPNWNVTAQYRKITSPGYYNIQRTNHDNASFTTNYQSPNQHYELYSALVYNKEQNDENGGLVNDSLVADPTYVDKGTIPVNFQNDNFGTGGRIPRSSVSNLLRDLSFMVQHHYAFGKTDTLYNEDSTQYRYKFTPRFGLTHRLQVSTTKYKYKDEAADSLRYAEFFQARFTRDPLKDSVDMSQRWRMIDNRLLLNGYIGKYSDQLSFSAGLGIRFDQFKDEYPKGNIANNITSNYLVADAVKEADTGEWYYSAKALFYLTGEAAGNSLLQAEFGKDFGPRMGNVLLGARQEINNAPYNYTTYQHDFDTILTTFDKESITRIYGTVSNPRLKLYGGARDYIIGNYIYLNEQQLSAQYAPSFNLWQVWLQKIFTWRSLVFDNELVLQQASTGAPVNVPLLLGRHQLSVEAGIFRRLLKVATGVEVRYHSPYKSGGYAPLFNRFYYQNSYPTLVNDPEVSLFFNFRIKRFRCYVMADQFQYIFTNANAIAAPGYPLPSMMIRFGFSWILIN